MTTNGTAAKAVAIFCNCEITGTGAGTVSCPLYEVPLLVDLYKRVSHGETVSVLPDWPAHVPRIRPLGEDELLREWERLSRRYGNYQVGEGVHEDFLTKIYRSEVDLARTSQRLWTMWREIAADRQPDIEDLKRLVAACRPSAAALADLETITVDDLRQEAEQAQARAWDGEAPLLAHLLEVGVEKPTAEGLVAVCRRRAAEGQPPSPTIEDVTSANVPGIAGNRGRAGEYRKLVREFLDSGAVSATEAGRA